MLKQHYLSAAFPAMRDFDFDALSKDIAENGLHLAITLFEGEIIDGWHRYKGCLESGVEPRFEELGEGVDPVAFVRSRNLRRRDLTPSQRAAATVACCEWAKAGNPNLKSNVQPSCTLSTNQEMAKEADVSTETIRQAKVAHAAGLGEKVRDGELTAKKAAELARPKRLEEKKATGSKEMKENVTVRLLDNMPSPMTNIPRKEIGFADWEYFGPVFLNALRDILTANSMGDAVSIAKRAIEEFDS